MIASFASYALEKRLSKTPERFGNGAIEGVAGPEAANNAAAGGAFIPLMTLGIPPNVVMALLLGAFVIHGLQPGPLMITQNPGLFWGIVASMYIGNLMLLVLNLPMIGMWVQLLKLPYNILFPLIILFTIIGVYCSSNNVFDVYVMIAFGVIGYFMRKLGYEPAPLVLAFVLGPMLENNLRKSLILSQGDLMTFVERPISAVCLAFAVVLLVGPLLPALRKKREMVALDEGRVALTRLDDLQRIRLRRLRDRARQDQRFLLQHLGSSASRRRMRSLDAPTLNAATTCPVSSRTGTPTPPMPG